MSYYFLFLLKPTQNNKGRKILIAALFESFLQLAAEKKDSINGTARKCFCHSYFEMKTRGCVQSYEGYQILRPFALGVYEMSFITITEDRTAPKQAYEMSVPFDDKPISYPTDINTTY